MAGADPLAAHAVDRRTAATTAVVVNYFSESHLQECLECLRDSDVPLNVVVVHNGGDLAAVKAAAGAHQAQLLINDDNVGYPAACNQGAAAADTPNLLFANPDCRVAPNCVRELEAALLTPSTAAIAGAMVMNVDGSEQRGTRRRLPTPLRIAFTMTGMERLAKAVPFFGGVNVVGKPPKHPADVEAVSGALFLIRREVFEAVQGFDESYFLHVEDLDLFRRVHHAGHMARFVPNARAVHDKGVSQRGRPVLASRYKHAGMLRYLRKFHPGFAYGPGGWLVAALVWTHFALTAPFAALRSRRP